MTGSISVLAPPHVVCPVCEASSCCDTDGPVWLVTNDNGGHFECRRCRHDWRLTSTTPVDALVIRDLAAENAQLRAELAEAVHLVMQTMTVAVAMASLRKAEAVTMQEKIRGLQHELWTRPGPDSRTMAEDVAMRLAAREAAEAARADEDAEAAEAAAECGVL